LSTELAELGKKSTISFIAQIIKYFVTVFSTIIIGKFLGAKIYGQYVYIVSVLSFFVALAKMGLDSGVVSFLARNTITREQKKSLLTYAVLVAAIISTCLVTIGYLNINFISNKILNNVQYKYLLILMIPTIIIDSVKSLFRNSLRALRRVHEILFIGDITTPLINILIVVFVVICFKMKSPVTLIIGQYLSTIALLIYYIIRVKKLGFLGNIDWRLDNKQILLFSIPLLLAGITNTLTANIDKYMLGFLLGAKEVGIYRSAVEYAQIPNLALVSVNLFFGPLIANLYYDNRKKELFQMYHLATKAITIFSLFVFGIIVLFSTQIMGLAGNEFREGGTVLILVALGQVFNASIGSVALINTMTGHPKLTFIASFTALISNIILNSIMIKPFGMNGAAIATMFSIIITNLVSFFFMYKNLKMQPYDKSSAKLLLTFCIATFCVYGLQHFTSLHNIFLCLIIYIVIFTIILATFVITKKERNALHNLIKKRIC
jgi:O-antigen/teichoic acid export membrane protein